MSLPDLTALSPIAVAPAGDLRPLMDERDLGTTERPGHDAQRTIDGGRCLFDAIAKLGAYYKDERVSAYLGKPDELRKRVFEHMDVHVDDFKSLINDTPPMKRSPPAYQSVNEYLSKVGGDPTAFVGEPEIAAAAQMFNVYFALWWKDEDGSGVSKPLVLTQFIYPSEAVKGEVADNKTAFRRWDLVQGGGHWEWALTLDGVGSYDSHPVKTGEEPVKARPLVEPATPDEVEGRFVEVRPDHPDERVRETAQNLAVEGIQQLTDAVHLHSTNPPPVITGGRCCHGHDGRACHNSSTDKLTPDQNIKLMKLIRALKDYQVILTKQGTPSELNKRKMLQAVSHAGEDIVRLLGDYWQQFIASAGTAARSTEASSR